MDLSWASDRSPVLGERPLAGVLDVLACLLVLVEPVIEFKVRTRMETFLSRAVAKGDWGE